MTSKSLRVALAVILPLSLLAVTSYSLLAPTVEAGEDAALKRTRKQVRMLDDLYKTVVVLITDKYVHSEEDFPAGSAAVALFSAMKKKGWHEVRLIDVAGEPLRRKNIARGKFEKAAVAALEGGKAYYDEVEEAGKDRFLRAATAIPVVSTKCIMCHDNYKNAKKGAAIGALSYKIKIE